MPASAIRFLTRPDFGSSLGSCPECGRAVPADADALLYGGGFYHLVCALWRRERGGRAPAAAR